MASRRKAKAAGESGFEESLAKLEAIVAAMEEEQLPLEDLVAKYEQGIQLLGSCERVLGAAKKRLETIAAEHRGEDGGEDSLDPDAPLTDEAPGAPDADDDDDEIRLF